MNISVTPAVSSLSATSATSAVAGTTDRPALPGAVDDATGAAHTHFSTFGELMSKLQELQSSDPDKAKQVLSSIATALSDKAKTGDAPDSHLQDLADRFSQAAQTGDLSALRPHTGHHHHAQVDGQPPTATSDVPGANPGRSASYLRGANDRRDEIESIISNALSGAQ
jgi:hypothetical protein